MVVLGGGAFYEKGTPVAGASCFVLGVSMFVLHSTLLPRGTGSRHESQVDLLELGLCMHGNSHLKGLTSGTELLLSRMSLVGPSAQFNSTQRGFSKLWNWFNSTQLNNKLMIHDTGSTQHGWSVLPALLVRTSLYEARIHEKRVRCRLRPSEPL